MSEHVSEARIHEAIDGALSAAQMESLRRHLESCGPCRESYARLSEVVGALRSLPRGARPPESVWDGIRARIEGVDRDGGTTGETTVLTLPAAESRGEDPPAQERRALGDRTVRMSVRQLAAAAAVVAFVSAGIMRLATGGGSTGAEPTPVAEQLPGGAAARAVAFQPAQYGETVARLEQILAERRDLLAPETLVTIEESLATVDAAIAEIETALEEDPNSDLLQRLLTSHRSRKLGVLQRAAGAVQART